MRRELVALVVALAGCVEDDGVCTLIGYCDTGTAEVGRIEEAQLDGALVDLCIDTACDTSVLATYGATFPTLHASVNKWPAQDGTTLRVIELRMSAGDVGDFPDGEALVTVRVRSGFDTSELAMGTWTATYETRTHPSGPRCGMCRSVSLALR